MIIPVNQSIDQTNYYKFEGGFPPEELLWIDNLAKLYPYQEATVVGSEETLEGVRKSKIKWIGNDSGSLWLYQKLLGCAIEANRIWGFNLHSIIDSIQYTEYYEGGGHYDWHVDIGPYPINHRKISITVQLSSTDDYEGGEFELWTGGEFKSLPKIKGSILLFPSFTMHRVTPVTRGVRRSLVLWLGGDSYK